MRAKAKHEVRRKRRELNETRDRIATRGMVRSRKTRKVTVKPGSNAVEKTKTQTGTSKKRKMRKDIKTQGESCETGATITQQQHELVRVRP